MHQKKFRSNRTKLTFFAYNDFENFKMRFWEPKKKSEKSKNIFFLIFTPFYIRKVLAQSRTWFLSLSPNPNLHVIAHTKADLGVQLDLGVIILLFINVILLGIGRGMDIKAILRSLSRCTFIITKRHGRIPGQTISIFISSC